VDSLCTQGKGIVYHYRRHDFFLRPRLYDKWAVYAAEEGGEVVGSISVCLKRVFYGKTQVDIGYIFDLRVHPAYRRAGLATSLTREAGYYLLREGAQYVYVYILSSNLVAKAMARKMGMFPAASFRVFFLSTHGKDAKSLHLTGKEELQNPLANIDAKFSNYDLSEPTTFLRNHQPSRPGSAFRGVLMLPGSPDALCCLWDSSVLSAKVVDRVPPVLRAAACMPAPLRIKLRLPEVPEKGETLKAHHIFNMVWQEEREAAALIAAARVRIGREGGQIVMCHLDARDPLCSIIKKQAFYSISGSILLRTPVEGEKPPPISLAYLDVRDF
jgi:GNAT superfamily N-acetyltransferase